MSEPKCPYFKKCGGCSAQHIDYPLQLENQQKMLASLLGIDESEVLVFSDAEYGYRNRMDFVFHSRGLGFRRKGDWKTIIDIKKCPISNQRLNVLLNEVRAFFTEPDFFDTRKKQGTFKYAVIRTPSGGASISFVLNSDSSRLQDAISLVKTFAETTTAENIIVTYTPSNSDVSTSDDFFVIKGNEMLSEKYMGNTFKYHVQGFFQNNHEVSSLLHKYCHELLCKYGENTKNAHLLDLYGGVGTFGINNASLFKDVKIVEGFAQSIDAANENIKLNSVSNVSAIVKNDAQLKSVELESPLFVITDPPRSGMNPKAIKTINRMKPEVIIYISCNPAQLRKDIKKFQGYKLKSAAVFDMFPQTPHTEAAVELVREKN